jgi:multidrug resistance efflux pump
VSQLTINSPAYGTIGQMKLESGDRISGETTLFEILDNARLHIAARIPVGVAYHLDRGTTVAIEFPDGQKRIGIVADVPSQTSSTADSVDPFVLVKIEPAGKLWPGIAAGSNVRVVLP